MKIKIQDIPDDGLDVTIRVKPDEWGLSEKGLLLLEAVNAALHFDKQGEGEIYVRGTLSTTMKSECSRCLKHFPYPLRFDFHLAYVPGILTPSGGEHVLSHESLDLHYYEGKQIDIDDELIAQLFLMVPISPLCDSGCRGLCPQCGEDLNRNKCLCPGDAPDLRWADLKNFS